MTQLIADVSKWQYPIDPVKLAGMVDEVICRVCHGSLKDIQFEGYYAGLFPLTPVSGYIYVTTFSSAATQAGVFLAAIAGKQIKRAIIDCEENDSGWSKTVLAAHYKAIIDAIKAARPEIEIVVYTRGEWWNTNVGNPAWASGYKLMIARYPLQHPWGDNPAKFRPLPWLDYWAWQAYADGDNWGPAYGAGSDDIDISIVNPYRVTPTTDPPPDPEPEPCPPCPPLPRLKVLTNWLNVRSAPVVGNNIVGTLAAGTEVEVFNHSFENGSRVWVKHSGTAEKWSAAVYDGKQHMEEVVP